MDAGAPRRGERARPRGPRQEPQVPAPRSRGFGARSLRRLGGERAAPPTRSPGRGLGPAATPAPRGAPAAAPRRPGSPCASFRPCAPEFTRQPRRWLSILLGGFGVRRRAREEGDGRRCRTLWVAGAGATLAFSPGRAVGRGAGGYQTRVLTSTLWLL